jgi:hypothetical protein
VKFALYFVHRIPVLATAVQAELQGVPKPEENGKDGFKDEVRMNLQCKDLLYNKWKRWI